MIELTKVIPDVIVLLTLQPEELGAKLLFLLRRRNFPRGNFLPTALNAEIWPDFPLPGQESPYPTNRRAAVDIALAEAWAWLEAQGLIVRAPDSNGDRGWKILSRRAQRFESEAEFAQYVVVGNPQIEGPSPQGGQFSCSPAGPTARHPFIWSSAYVEVPGK
jgi:hypothetical protein